MPGPGGVPGGDPPRTTTAAGGTHPTGMHSCFKRHKNDNNANLGIRGFMT